MSAYKFVDNKKIIKINVVNLRIIGEGESHNWLHPRK